MNFSDLLQNKALIAGLVAWLLAQIIKIPLGSYKLVSFFMILLMLMLNMLLVVLKMMLMRSVFLIK